MKDIGNRNALYACMILRLKLQVLYKLSNFVKNIQIMTN